ncbi:MAG: TVP38/TMEM64 family protein [Cyanothece sp. SIO2G6]|nr:TVP38/TMEM64 family protein [Cyanothece sp. SIO2G6]
MKRLQSIARFVSIAALVLAAILLFNHYGITRLRSQVEDMGAWALVGIFLLRFTSVVIPALPGTAYSILAGGLLGFPKGLAVICIADLLSCSLSFFLSRRFGRGLVQKLVGDRFIDKVDTLSKRHLERNFFLMTGCLMTGFFDFVCYAVGLTKTPWRQFAPALIISIAVSNPPIVALGDGLLDGGKLILGFALLGVFGLAIVTGLVKREQPISDTDI